MRRSRIHHMEPPVRGWNCRDAEDSLPPSEAIILDNWIPTIGGLKVRKGYVNHVTRAQIGLGGGTSQFETLTVYKTGKIHRLIAADAAGVYDVTGPASGFTLGTGYSNGRWSTANFHGKLLLVNGYDAPKYYDYTDIANLQELEVSGEDLNPSDLIGVHSYKNRTYFWEKESQDFWYSALYAAGGTLTKFPLSRVSGFGGHLVSINTWTMDGGSGPDDFMVFFMSGGDAVVYQGSSPQPPSSWSIVGIYRVGEILSPRSVVKDGPDLLLMTDFDIVRFSQAMLGDIRTVRSTKVVTEYQNAVKAGKHRFGWEATVYPNGKMIIFNIPAYPLDENVIGAIATQGDYNQYIYNAVTDSWCRFLGLEAHTFCVFDGNLYFGMQNAVVRADYGYLDGTSAIKGMIRTSWNGLRTNRNKSFIAINEVYKSPDDININNVFAYDFESYPSNSYPSVVTPTGVAWNANKWDEHPWITGTHPAGFQKSKEWTGITGIGRVMSMEKKTQTKQKLEWLRSNLQLEDAEEGW